MTIKEQVLSRKQMAHLRELGIDTSDASLCWHWSDEDGGWVLRFMNPLLQEISNPPHREGPFPAYTIGDLIEKLPKKIPYGHFSNVYLQLATSYSYIENDSELRLCVKYESYGWPDEKVYTKSAPDGNNFDIPLKDRLYYTLCWIAENYKDLL